MFRVYIACLASYNAGTLYGEWVEISGLTADEIREEIARVLKGSPEPQAEEWAFHDHQGFDGYKMSENPDLEALADHMDAYSSSEYACDLIEGVCDNLGVGAREAIEYIDNNYQGEHKSLEDWADDYLDQSGELSSLPKHLSYYFDYSAYARDCELNGDIFSISTNGGVYVLSNC